MLKLIKIKHIKNCDRFVPFYEVCNFNECNYIGYETKISPLSPDYYYADVFDNDTGVVIGTIEPLTEEEYCYGIQF